MRFGINLTSPISAALGVAAEWWKPVAAALALAVILVMTGPGSTTDRQLSDRLLRSQALPTDPRALIVDIDAADFRAFGGPPINRGALAQGLERLADGGAERVLLDTYLGDLVDQRGDARLAAAMTRFGPARLGLVTGATIQDLPHPQFLDKGTLIDGRLTPDLDGNHRQIGRTSLTRGVNPATWLATGKLDNTPVSLDIRVATRGFERRSLRQLIASRDSLAGRTVVVSLNSTISPTRAILPLSVRGDRAGVLSLGAQSVKEGRQHARAEASNIGIALQLTAIALGLLCALSVRSGKAMIRAASTVAVVLFAANLGLGRLLAIEIFPVRTLGVFLVMVNVTLIQRLRIIPMMGSFLRGDLSPEEVWAWRSHKQSANPALLLSFDGRIKRFNPAAAELAALHGDWLAQACLPKLGAKAERLLLEDPHKGARTYEAEWPNAHAPIVILRDVTDAESNASVLRQQLLTDELTGMANRRGFDHALQGASTSDQPYAVYFLDMNGFKAVNDSYGHDAGDELLVRSARRLVDCVRPSDTVARLGGDEFAILVKGAIGEIQAATLAAKLGATISEPFSLESSGGEVEVGIAVGYARSEEVGNDPAELLRLADKAMYRDKVRGKLKAAA